MSKVSRKLLREWKSIFLCQLPGPKRPTPRNAVAQSMIVKLSILMLTASAVVMAQAPARSTSKVGSNDRPELQQREATYRIQPGDTFDLDFALTPEFNQTVSVMPDGYVSLRGVMPVAVSGQTIAEAVAAITKAYAHVLSQPRIAILLKDFAKPSVYVAGSVARPGKYEMREPTTVFEAITMAGGFLDSAKHSQVILFRDAGNNMLSARLINVKEMLKEADMREDVELRPGDMVYVPQNMLSKIAPYIPRPGIGVYGTIPIP